ncbi:MAG: hypothetical protein R2695_15150 [Acidimicrobiales bacterium]
MDGDAGRRSPYTTRIGDPPIDPADFAAPVPSPNILNVSGGLDTAEPSRWATEQISGRGVRRRVGPVPGIEQSPGTIDIGFPFLCPSSPALRAMSHPGDSFSADIFTQAGTSGPVGIEPWAGSPPST